MSSTRRAHEDSEDIVLRQRLLGAVKVIHATVRVMLIIGIIKQKRRLLDRKIQKNMRNGVVVVNSISYASAGILFRKMALYATDVVFKVATKLKRGGF